MKKTWKRLCTGFLALATVVTALPTTPVHAESKQYWTESKERVGIVEKVMNDGPEAPLNIGAVERHPEELERVYQIGRKEGEKRLREVKKFLKRNTPL